MTDSALGNRRIPDASDIPVAYVTARYPPMISSGTFRVEAVLEHLPPQGFSPRVVTIPWGWVKQQSDPMREVSPPPSDDVFRPRTGLDPLVRLGTRIPLIRRLIRDRMVPDVLARWASAVADETSRRMAGCELVYATAPPFSSLILAESLSRRLGVPLVNEVRDPPSFNRRLRTRRKSFIERMVDFERSYLSAADRVIVVTPGTRLELLRLHPELDPDRVVVVPNGYPELTIDPKLATTRDDEFTITYVGTFQGGTRERPNSWFSPEALLPFVEELPGGATVRVVGQLMRDQAQSLARWGPVVRTTGHLPREAALAEIAAADVALILAEAESWWIGRKVYEYLAYARRILAVVPPGDTADLLASSAKSLVVHPGDEQGLRNALQRLHEDWASGSDPVDEEPVVHTDRQTVESIARVLRDAMA